jgi:hypothetical protein
MNFNVIDQYWEHNTKLWRHSVIGIWRVSSRNETLEFLHVCQTQNFEDGIMDFYKILYQTVSSVSVDKIYIYIYTQQRK